MNDEIQKTEQVRDGFQKTLNTHGYGFQYAVLKAAQNPADYLLSTFVFEVAEFPVEVQKNGTRIDFMLRRSKNLSPSFSNYPLYLLAECKRANPALSNWCFIDAPFTQRGQSNQYDKLITDSMVSSGLNERLVVEPKVKLWAGDKFFRIGLEVRSDKVGDNAGHNGRAIEDAATQVLRGLNGFIEFLSHNSNAKQIISADACDLLPVIFTTANLWTASTNLGETDINTGNVDIKPEEFSKADWLLFQYNQSPGLIHHSLSKNDNMAETAGDWLDLKSARTIPIVSSSGFDSFFRWVANLKLS